MHSKIQLLLFALLMAVITTALPSPRSTDIAFMEKDTVIDASAQDDHLLCYNNCYGIEEVRIVRSVIPHLADFCKDPPE